MKARIPDNMRIYAIGDIHGCAKELTELLELVASREQELPETGRRMLVFLGDYIDRGPDSRGVVEILLHQLPEGFSPIFLRGNHEAMMLDAINHPGIYQSAAMWLFNGGMAAVASYDQAIGGQLELAEWLDMDIIIDDFIRIMPDEHRRFFESLRLSYQCGDYFFVHAGVLPGLPLDEQKESDMLWIREPFLNSQEDFGAVIVHGHTPARQAEIKPNRIGLDSGAVYGRKLSAIRLEGIEQEILSVNSRQKP